MSKFCLLDVTLCGLAEIFRRFYNEDVGDGKVLSTDLVVTMLGMRHAHAQDFLAID